MNRRGETSQQIINKYVTHHALIGDVPFLLPTASSRRLVVTRAPAYPGRRRADGNDATDRHSFATIIAAITTDLPLSTFRWQSGVQLWVAVHKHSPFTAKWPIMSTAQTYKISPSIITGQFQHYCGSYSVCRDLLATVN